MIYATNKPTDISTRSWLKSINYGHYGHFGTLDPFASGLIFFGPNGKLAQYIHDFCPKTYEARGCLGSETLTQDSTSEIVQQDDSDYFQSLKNLKKEELEKKFHKKFYPHYLQSIPFFSATKHEGKPLYSWARDGIKIYKEPVQRKIYSFKILKIEFPYIDFQVTVGSGTYIRQLFVDMAKEFMTLGHLVKLKRTAMGNISLQEKDFWKIELEDLFSFPKESLENDLWSKMLNGERSFLKEQYYFIEQKGKVEAFVDGFKKKVVFIKS